MKTLVADHSSPFKFDWIFFAPADNKDNHKIWDGFEILQDQNSGYRISWPWASEKISIDLKLEKCCDHSSFFNLGWVFFILSGNNATY